MVKYNCTPDPEQNPKSNLIPSQSRSERPRPILTSEWRKKRKTSANKRGESSAPPRDQNPNKPSTSEVERNAQAFNNAITWIEIARENFDALGQIVKDNTIFKILGVLDSPKIILSIVIPIHMYFLYMI